MTKALAALSDATYGGVYYSDDLDFTNPLAVPTWTRLPTTGLANTLLAIMQVDYAQPYDVIYLQLQNDDIYKYNGTSWDKIMDLATARTLSGLASGNMSYIAANKTVAGRIYVGIAQTAASTKVLYSTDYGANWTVSTASTYVSTTGTGFISASGNDVWLCYGHLYRSLRYSSNNCTTWNSDYPAWNSSGGGDQVNIDPLNGTNVYYQHLATDDNLTKFYYSGGAYGHTILQNGSNLGWSYLNGSSPDRAGLHWISPYTGGTQMIYQGDTGTLYQSTDGFITLVEASPTAWAIACTNLATARENETYTLIGMADSAAAMVYGWVATDTSSAPWIMAGANYGAAPFTDSIPKVAGAYIVLYGIYVGEAPASKGVYVYADEQGDILDIPDYDGLGTPMFGDRASWRDRPADGWHVYHAEDVQRVAPQIHTPIPSGNDGYGIVESAGVWVNSDDVLAMVGDLHNAVTLDADADVLLDLSTQEIGLDEQNANTVFAGPATAPANEPTFRALVLADLPAIALDDLSDVDTTGVADGEILGYDQASATWVPVAQTVDTDTYHQHTYQEDLSAFCDGSRTVFYTANSYEADTSMVWLNGVLQRPAVHYDEDTTSYDTYTFDTAPVAGDELLTAYVVKLT